MSQLFNVDLLPESHDAIAFLYDAEPDDNAALLMFASAYHKSGSKIPLMFVIGEGMEEKFLMACYQAKLLGLPCLVAQGPLSKKQFPLKEMAQPITYDQCNFVEYVTFPRFGTFLTEAKNPLLIVMKPFSELFSVDTDVLKKTTVVFYGSFNFSSTCALLSASVVEHLVNNSFKRVVVFESFLAMGADNNLSPKNAPDIYNLFDFCCKNLSPFHDYCQFLQHTIQVWNAHIASRQLKSLEKTVEELQRSWNNVDVRTNLVEKLHRSKQIVSNIAADSQQMVFADTGLMACILAAGRDAVKSGRVTSCKISFDPKTGYTKLAEGQGNVLVIQNLDKNLLIKAFGDSLQ